ncbi:MAG: chemotaxis protein CheB [Pseudomonadota bacterium]
MIARKRVVLLAREGVARSRTEAAVLEAGADIAALLDPAVAVEADVRGVNPDAVLVILDPAVEQVLDRFDGVLGDPGFEIMFEDADVAAKREGWEAARWARHLRAKLYGHDDVLPQARDVASFPADPAGHGSDARFHEELDDLRQRMDAMPDVPAANAGVVAAHQGVVMVVAGVGGPDAVRQLLGGVPAGFPRAIVLRQRLEGGQYDKLVRQMQRATQLQVTLAESGDPLQAGKVYVLPEGLEVQATPVGLLFAPSAAGAPFATLPAGDSAVLLLSGSDPALVDAAMTLSWGGALVLGQAPDGCFDPAASNALVARGGQAESLARLPLKLLQRWPA